MVAEHHPICRQDIELVDNIERKVYQKHSDQDQRKIVNTANKSRRRLGTFEHLIKCAVQKKTYWCVRYGDDAPLPKGGKKSKALSEAEIDVTISRVEDDPGLTLKQILCKV